MQSPPGFVTQNKQRILKSLWATDPTLPSATQHARSASMPMKRKSISRHIAAPPLPFSRMPKSQSQTHSSFQQLVFPPPHQLDPTNHNTHYTIDVEQNSNYVLDTMIDNNYPPPRLELPDK
eukprot:1169742-Rhodomonas_salina.1